MIEDSSSKLSNQRQFIARNQLSLNRERDRLRKIQTRQKIQLGGLIVKVGLETESSNVLLGLLCEAKSKIHIERERWRQLGDEKFSKK